MLMGYRGRRILVTVMCVCVATALFALLSPETARVFVVCRRQKCLSITDCCLGIPAGGFFTHSLKHTLTCTDNRAACTSKSSFSNLTRSDTCCAEAASLSKVTTTRLCLQGSNASWLSARVFMITSLQSTSNHCCK